MVPPPVSDAVFAAPAHPYTEALVAAVPLPDPAAQRARRKIILQGDPPSPIGKRPGCPFVARCPIRIPVCSERRPALVPTATGQNVACFVRTQLS
ncbi:hypothetical protein JNW90_17575 [Micromonospora sp. STR1s_5]|nr:hypothetical protein [Micromonospora sp. STR1s_5]